MPAAGFQVAHFRPGFCNQSTVTALLGLLSHKLKETNVIANIASCHELEDMMSAKRSRSDEGKIDLQLVCKVFKIDL